MTNIHGGEELDEFDIGENQVVDIDESSEFDDIDVEDCERDLLYFLFDDVDFDSDDIFGEK